MCEEKEIRGNFITDIIDEHNRSGRYDARVHTRFPPEPNGCLHIGHAKSILLNYGLAQRYDGLFNLRFDDTNPEMEEQVFVDSVIEDVKWLGADFGERLYFASDYFNQMYDYALQLIEAGKAYVDDQNGEEIRKTRGTVTSPGANSPWRERSVEENRDLFTRMRAGEFADGEKVLRAKIDMAHPNMLMRDPLIYRIRHAEHHRTGKDWCIYPMYDWAHGLEDSIEGITQSVCTLEFETHRPLYDWYLDSLDVFHPQQIEFARLNLAYTMMSKRKLRQIVEEGIVESWDDPRMPTISGMRRRGYTPEAIAEFCERIGVAKSDSLVDMALLEFCVREDLNRKAPRRMAVLNPLKLTITNYPEDKVEMLPVENNPGDPEAGSREVPFRRELFVEREDFREEAPKKWFRLAPGKEVRLKGAYFVTCEEVLRDESGEIVELLCRYDPESRGGESPDGRKVRGTLHWVSIEDSLKAEVRLYDHLFSAIEPGSGGDFHEDLNPESLKLLRDCRLEPSLGDAEPGEAVQFMRQGYFVVDSIDSSSDQMVFNRTVGLRDSWAKIEKKANSPK
ncbi:MAG: glutamine--tRNA ligase/YqeY domain fusion protein [Candidatus Krumholzibacteria bacterium]|jgi:glutaminyl-tRNA synthetase|nr:glutamine--tRNA ligase/YqeY domain fusion protein [Candidatus Krumholzibacteria bacterium]MDP7021758.1 glutamine--tRNA ligase/YqeY domain fusion protein [Candidatus Krumholzibacteria bacterium]